MVRRTYHDVFQHGDCEGSVREAGVDQHVLRTVHVERNLPKREYHFLKEPNDKHTFERSFLNNGRKHEQIRLSSNWRIEGLLNLP